MHSHGSTPNLRATYRPSPHGPKSKVFSQRLWEPHVVKSVTQIRTADEDFFVGAELDGSETLAGAERDPTPASVK